MIEIYNTLGRTLQKLDPLVEGSIGIYVCGPTVQSEPHLGHGRFAVAFDAIRRYLIWSGFDVTYVQNVTDVDDKIINGAAELGVSPEDLAVEMADRFRASSGRLNILTPSVEPRATGHIPEMIDLIERLIEADLAYPAGGDVYFRVRRHDGYGKLSGRNVDDLRAGARIEPGEDKDDPLDFALWKGAKLGEPSWASPWGPGRPGWHIECSAMAAKYLGTTFDIHAGGNDLIFPHHENEIAQSEGATGEPFATYWMHNGMVNLGGQKMAKSTGHIIKLEEAIEQYGGAAVRLFYLRAQYRSPLEFSDELLQDAAAAVDRLRAFNRRGSGLEATDPDSQTISRFTDAMNDDFNTSEALSVLFEAVRVGNTQMDAGEDAAAVHAAFVVMAEVLGIELAAPVAVDDLAEELAGLASTHGVSAAAAPADIIDALLIARARARDDRQWDLADAIRNGLEGLGIAIEDSADGVRWHRR